MRDLTALVDTVDCTTPGCPHEAEKDGLCRHCVAAKTRPRKAWDPTEALRQLAPEQPASSPADRQEITPGETAPHSNGASSNNQTPSSHNKAADAAPIVSVAVPSPPTEHRKLEPDEEWTADRIILAACAWRDQHGKPPKANEWQSGGLSPREWPRYRHVRKHWDTWDEFLTAAGLPLHPVRPSTSLNQPQPEPETSSPEAEVGSPPSEPQPDGVTEGSGTGGEAPLPYGWTRLWTREIDFTPYGWEHETDADWRWLPLNVAALHLEECAELATSARDRYLAAIRDLELARQCFTEISQIERAKVDELLWEAP